MTTSLLENFERHSNVRYFSSTLPDLKIEEAKDGTAIVRGLPVFRTGTFRDSLGIQHTWDSSHLQQMVFHYGLLKENGIWRDVPVRADHSFSVDKLVGYLESLSVSAGAGPEGSDLLLADYAFTEPAAYEKFKRGTYRARSAEIGLYETNDEAMYWPVFMGFAFVDIGAVEGLYSRTTDKFDGKAVVLFEQERPSVGDENKPTTFTIGGREVADHAAVQDYITTLETAASARVLGDRSAYVDSLVSDHKIANAKDEVEGLKAVVATFTDEQYRAWKAIQDKAPKMPLFGKFSDDVTNANGEAPDADQELADQEAIVASLRNAGIDEETIKKGAAFQRLTALKTARGN